jgi:hypothetical protein
MADAEPSLNLKDPTVAGLLAWAVPGLGHFYQGRYAKAVLYLVCILGLYVWGLVLGGGAGMGPARVVYFSFRNNDMRPHYLCQLGVGLPSLPALLQAILVSHGREPLFDGFMAPPHLEPDRPDPEHAPPAHRTLADLNLKLAPYFEIGATFTMIAGLLNILAIYDACCGPVPPQPAKKEDDDEGGKEKGEGEEKAEKGGRDKGHEGKRDEGKGATSAGKQ